MADISGLVPRQTYLIFGKVRPYGIDFGSWHWWWWLVEKIICPINWQQSLWRPKQKHCTV